MSWYAQKTAGGHQGMVACDETGRTVALVYDPDDTQTLAAGRDALEACRMLVSLGGWTGKVPDGFNAAWDAAISALAKSRT